MSPARRDHAEADLDVNALLRHADLPLDAPGELIGPLIRGYLARIRSHPRADLFGEEPAFRFDPSWDDEP